MNRYGFEDAVGEAGKAQAMTLLCSYARRGLTITYSDFVASLTDISFEGPHDPRLPHFLGELSTYEASAGRGMISALVVHAIGEGRPGLGFFQLAAELGRDATDQVACWSTEITKVFEANSTED
jgi:hypothetical protein